MLYRILCFIVIIIHSAILSIIYCEIVVIDYLNDVSLLVSGSYRIFFEVF